MSPNPRVINLHITSYNPYPEPLSRLLPNKNLSELLLFFKWSFTDSSPSKPPCKGGYFWNFSPFCIKTSKSKILKQLFHGIDIIFLSGGLLLRNVPIGSYDNKKESKPIPRTGSNPMLRAGFEAQFQGCSPFPAAKNRWQIKVTWMSEEVVVKG